MRLRAFTTVGGRENMILTLPDGFDIPLTIPHPRETARFNGIAEARSV
jgi:hypothetical protein